MFRKKMAWFSKSVSGDLRRLWVSEGGLIASWTSAEYLFSADASCPDTRRVFESADYVDDRVAVFHSSCLSACEQRQNMESLTAGHYLLPPACVQKEVKAAVGCFIWEQEDNHNMLQMGQCGCENQEPQTSYKALKMENPGKKILCCNTQHYPTNNKITGYVSVNDLKRYPGELHDFRPGCSGFSLAKVSMENTIAIDTTRKSKLPGTPSVTYNLFSKPKE
ncbi:telomere repeats-binding bouquet formation protein 2 [Paramormyrops kingsleyae]|uniref:Telomere repeat binding bouquet formation protein 2 n=1 Tax=Paramormyrops kingsleyae TaxID=1676925 RepID=A0A3B3QIQ5_9TELE|nr:telomere repeats-binding bouquet formation protein 2 [Paramormyrops kingsleyae]